jgi:hypothetical protein
MLMTSLPHQTPDKPMAVPEDDEKPYLTVEEEIALSKPENGDMYVPSALFYLSYKEPWSWFFEKACPGSGFAVQ